MKKSIPALFSVLMILGFSVTAFADGREGVASGGGGGGDGITVASIEPMGGDAYDQVVLKCPGKPNIYLNFGQREMQKLPTMTQAEVESLCRDF